MSKEIRLNIEAEGVEPEPKYKDWEIEDAVRTILRAEEIKNDPELMALIKPKLEDHVKAAVNIANILYKKENKDEGQSN